MKQSQVALAFALLPSEMKSSCSLMFFLSLKVVVVNFNTVHHIPVQPSGALSLYGTSAAKALCLNEAAPQRHVSALKCTRDKCDNHAPS